MAGGQVVLGKSELWNRHYLWMSLSTSRASQNDTSQFLRPFTKEGLQLRAESQTKKGEDKSLCRNQDNREGRLGLRRAQSKNRLQVRQG